MNRRHKYAPSVVAVVLSASRMIATVQDLYDCEPHLTVRILGYWSNAFSAAVSIFSFVKISTLPFPWGCENYCTYIYVQFILSYFISFRFADSLEFDVGGSVFISISRTGHVYNTCGASGA